MQGASPPPRRAIPKAARVGLIILAICASCVTAFFAQYFYFHPDDLPFRRPPGPPRPPPPHQPHEPHGDFPYP